ALMLIGDKRSGKGTIARTLTTMLGSASVASPSFASLASEFGLAGIVGKKLAVIPDARVSGKTDTAMVAERILSWTGEDVISVNRKYKDVINVKLSARLMLVSNELPKFIDASGALARRFMVLGTQATFLGREDTELTAKLAPEVPQILH